MCSSATTIRNFCSLFNIYNTYPHHVCCLKKAIYGLKQAPIAWFHRFTTFLLTIGFSCCKSDSGLFVHSSANDILYVMFCIKKIGNDNKALGGLKSKYN